ncbi:MAG: cell division protein FtsH [Candidatus Portnoybacteria bacterium CG10_big_fil_rev_8_21_14_0_10_36_7]|uniref:ATP-dependent zinc metalloprotease FtsH n=1 Tax=Candidatus Portnoybacteria bacterium CG10_big_fil_rev_8_21_14_0_10_36_7 TaxID=1974812 RepID=A0A2M8KDK3_9BACT|nr:MAG: cell division protein FtsH [Candidatus Portnoybacteria bacterium CG10_big_fil_rev_8_21_14_0_10_36_7]
MIKNLIKNLAIVILTIFIVAGIFSIFADSGEKITAINLSELSKQINEEKISKITINGNVLSIELKDGQKESSYKEEDSSLTDSFKNLGVDSTKLQNINFQVEEISGWKFWLGSLLPILLPFLLIGGFIWYMMKQAQRGSGQAFGFTKSLARMVNPQQKSKKTKFKDVAGLKEAKEELNEVVEFLKQPEKFKALGAKIPKGVLLIGPPGTGKTLLARAVSGEAGVPFFHISGSEFVELFVGVGASRVRDTFQTAKRSAPAILFIDELDAIGRHRGAGLGGGHDEREQTLNQILVEMDGFEPDARVIVISATNRPDILDPALLRPGRFDRRIILDEPDINDRQEILQIHMEGKPIDSTVDLRQIAERTPGFSGADLANLINESAILTARKNKKEISHDELLESIDKVMLGPERKSHILSLKEKKIAAYHEAGHALVNASLPHTDPVRKISIISRGRAAGYTLKLPTEDRHLHSRSELVEDLSTMLGGYAAEELIFNELTTGASNDLKQSSDLARKLVTKFGMSSSLGPVAFDDREEMVFLGREIAEDRRYSETTATKIDDEVMKFIKDAYKIAMQILKDNKPKLDKVAKTLIEKETIEREEFEQLIK